MICFDLKDYRKYLELVKEQLNLLKQQGYKDNKFLIDYLKEYHPRVDINDLENIF